MCLRMVKMTKIQDCTRRVIQVVVFFQSHKSIPLRGSLRYLITLSFHVCVILSKNKKNIKSFQLKIIFYSCTNGCILHKRVIVM